MATVSSNVRPRPASAVLLPVLGAIEGRDMLAVRVGATDVVKAGSEMSDVPCRWRQSSTSMTTTTIRAKNAIEPTMTAMSASEERTDEDELLPLPRAPPWPPSFTSCNVTLNPSWACREVALARMALLTAVWLVS
jgi:hypothetical protein